MAFKGIHTILNEIIEAKRFEGVITSYAVNGAGNYIYQSINNLVVPCYITIDNTSVPVLEANSSSFTLATEHNIPTWKENKPYFMHEKEIKAMGILTEKSNQETYKYQKYPLVLLVHPFTKKDTRMGDYSVDFRLIIANRTDKNYYSDDRYEANFDAILTPILNDIVDGLCEHVNINVANKNKIEMSIIDNLYINGNPLPDELDAIIIEFKNIIVVNSCLPAAVISDAFDVTTLIIGEGTINSNPEILTGIKKGTLVSLNATPTDGSRFVNWVVNGATYYNRLFSTIIATNLNAVLTLIKQWLATTSVNGEGTITPASGLKDEGIYTITVEPLNPLTHEFEKIEITPDGEATQTVLTNAYDWTVNKAVVIVGYVKEIITYWTLTVTKEGNGTVNPDVGDHQIPEGANTITANPDTDNEFIEFVDGVTPVTSNPYNYVMNGIRGILVRFGYLVPDYADAVEYWDGTIIDVLGVKYFKGKKGVADLLITGYDFDADWTKGLPYKSAAMLSAPAGNATLLASPMANFFYTAGVPNQIPVVSFYQDVDYAHLLYSKHEAQVLDGNGVETYEPRISKIVLYANTKIGAAKTTCDSFFGVPVEDINAKWVDNVNGLDTNSGTKASPWKTIDKANKTATAGLNIYVKTGTYLEQYNVSLQYLYLDKTLTYTSLGNCIIKSINIDRVLFFGSSTITLNGFTIDGENKTNSLITSHTVAISVIMQKCYFKNITNYTIYTGINTTVSFKFCLSYKNNNYTYYILGNNIIDSCFSENGVHNLKNTFSITNCKNIASTQEIVNILITNASGLIKGNTIIANTNGISILNVVSKPIDILYNKIIVNDRLSGSTLYGIVVPPSNTCALNISHNTFIQPKTGALVAVSGGFIFLVNQVAPIIENNKFISKTTSNFYAFYHLFNGSVISGKNKVNNNYAWHNNLSGFILSIGEENAYSNIADDSEIMNNTVIGSRMELPNSNTTTHAILVNCGKNMKIMYNKCSHSGIGIVIKTGQQDTYTTNGCSYNLCAENIKGIWIRGVVGLMVNNNTISHSNAIYSVPFTNCFIADENSAAPGNQYCENVIFKNNIIQINMNTGVIFMLDSHATANGCIAEYNQLYGCQYLLSDGTNYYSSLETAQAANKLLNCVVGNPNLDTNFIPATAIEHAENLGTDYDDGLDVTTDWGDENNLPVVVTKKQVTVGNWQAGAIVK